MITLNVRVVAPVLCAACAALLEDKFFQDASAAGYDTSHWPRFFSGDLWLHLHRH